MRAGLNPKIDYVLGSLILLILWKLAAWIGGPATVVGPMVTGKLLLEEASKGVFWEHVGASGFRIIVALVLAVSAASVIAVFLAVSPTADRIAKPLIYLTYPVPKIVLLPLALLIFGLGDGGKIFILWLILFFQILIPARDSAINIPKDARNSLLSLGGGRGHLIVHVIWPSSLPAIFTGLRIASGTVVAVLFFVESIASRRGMGFYILDAWGRGDVGQMYVGMVTLGLMGVGLYICFDLLERALLPWLRLEKQG